MLVQSIVMRMGLEALAWRRQVLLILIASLAGHASAQEDLFMTVRPEAFVVVRKHSLGPDLLEVTMVGSAFPPEVLADRVRALGQQLGSEPRGLSVHRHSVSPTMSFVRATFAVDGLWDQQTGIVRLQPIVRMFAGVPAPHTIEGFSVQIENKQPNMNTLRRFSSSAVQLQALANPGPIGLEYRVRILDQDLEQIEVPDAPEVPLKSKPSESPTGSGPDPTLWGLVIVAALSLGALVYSLMLRRAPSGKR